MTNESSIIKDLQHQIEKMRKGYYKERADILNALTKKFGPEVKEVVLDYVRQIHLEQWSNIAKKEGSNEIPDLIRTLWEPMKGDFEFIFEEKDGGIQIHCTRCPLADISRELGQEEWGYTFYCMSDFAIVEGFNPKIGFKRTKTLMEGDDCCDHFYYMKE